MITNINAEIKAKSGNQLGDPRSTLTKDIYFTPKNVSKFNLHFFGKIFYHIEKVKFFILASKIIFPKTTCRKQVNI